MNEIAVAARHKVGMVASGLASVGKNGGITLRPRPYKGSLPASPIMDDIHTVWDPKKFSNRREPIAVGTIFHRAVFSRSGVPSVTDMPVKFPGSPYRLPAELFQFTEPLQTCIDFEQAANKNVADYYAYLTVDHRFLNEGEYQRGHGLHSDSIQGRRIEPKTFIEHTYLCVDRDPTRYYAQPFDLMGCDTSTHWFNAVFEAQADPGRVVQLPPYSMALLDAYMVHAAIPASSAGPRTVFRLIFSVRKFDRIGNTHNDLFDYAWDMQPRPLPADLIGLPDKTTA